MEKNKSVGIISLYNHNYNCGGLLQAAALCEILKKLGYNAEQICFHKSKEHEPKKSLLQKIEYHVREKDFFQIVSLKIASKLHPNYMKDFPKSFISFESWVPHSERVYTEDTIAEVIEKYDIFITGSDQVWSWQFNSIEGSDKQPYLDAYFLNFVPADKLKIAYAPSIACPYIPDNLKQYYIDSINRLDAVSIREKSSLDLFPDDLRKKITPVCDPTLLLNGEQWCKSLNLNEKKTEQYIFLYLLNPSKSDRKIVRKLSKITGLKVITSPNITMSPTSYDYHLADIDDFNMGPKEFVNYIKDASLVLTNSFHAAVFSIQFHTPFYIIKRESKVSMSSRLDSLLDDYGLQDRQISETFDESTVSGYDNIDWDRVDVILNKNRDFSMQWLKNALGMKIV